MSPAKWSLMPDGPLNPYGTQIPTLIDAPDFTVTQETDQPGGSQPHRHMIIETAAYGELAVCAQGDVWNVAATKGVPDFTVARFIAEPNLPAVLRAMLVGTIDNHGSRVVQDEPFDDMPDGPDDPFN